MSKPLPLSALQSFTKRVNQLTDIAEQAISYIRRGWSPVPVVYKDKMPSCGRGWEQLRLTEDDVETHFNNGETNIGVILGPPSGGLVDIDLDCPEALRLARFVLPKTELRFGRESTPDSHWLYKAPIEGRTAYTDPITKETLVEIRSSGSQDKFHQTVFPPSVHTSGEQIYWSSDGDPLEIVDSKLIDSVSQLAALCLMVRYWPAEGGRQDFAMRVAGVLLRGGMPVDQANWIIELIASAAGDDDFGQRRIAHHTQTRLDNDEPTFGYSGLCEVVDEKVAATFTQWLDISPPADDHNNIESTQDWLALSFIDRNQSRVRYCHDHGCWFVWDGSIWQRDVTGSSAAAIRDWCRDFVDRLPNARNALGRYSTITAIEQLTRIDQRTAVTAAAWDNDQFLLGTPQGTVDLRTGLLKVSAATDMITKSTAVAPAPTSDCPLWRKFLSETTQEDAELQHYLATASGYACTGSTREHALFFVYGPGGNGKSVFVSTISRILGDYATTAMMETFVAARSEQRHPTELASLRGARLVTASETEEGRRWAESRIKALTGGETISARFMRQDAFEFRPQLKLLISGNHAPNLVNVDEAMRRRLHVIPFTNTPLEPDKELESKLEVEWPGILRWMIEGAVDWQKNGLVKPQIVVSATEDYFSEQNVFAHWLEQNCRVEPNNSHLFSTSRELFENWKAFAEANGEYAGTSKGLSSKLARAGLRTERRHLGKLVRGWVGVVLVDAETYSATEF